MHLSMVSATPPPPPPPPPPSGTYGRLMEDLTANWIIAGQHGGFDIGCGLLQMALRMTQRFFVLLPPYRRILDKSDDTEMESAVRALFSDVLKTGERIIIQVEEKWGDSTYFVDRELSGNSVLQVVRLQQVSVLYTVESYFYICIGRDSAR